MQIVVLGMHRSGTSAVARLINMMGAYVGPEHLVAGPALDNEKGFWERSDVRELNDRVLESVGAAWDDIHKLDLDTIPEETLRDFDAEAKRIVFRLDCHRPWVVKDPRLCLLFPLWRPHLEVPVCVHVARSPIEIAQSLKRRNGFSMSFGVALWEAYNRRALAASQDLPRGLVAYGKLMKDPQGTTQELLRFLAASGVQDLRRPTNTELTRFLDENLHHEREDAKQRNGLLTRAQLLLLQKFEQGTILEQKGLDRLPQGTRDTLEEHSVYRRTLGEQKSLLSRKDKELAELYERLTQNDRDLAEARRQLEQAERTSQDSRAKLSERDEELLQARARIASLVENATQIRDRVFQRERDLQQAVKGYHLAATACEKQQSLLAAAQRALDETHRVFEQREQRLLVAARQPIDEKREAFEQRQQELLAAALQSLGKKQQAFEQREQGLLTAERLTLDETCQVFEQREQELLAAVRQALDEVRRELEQQRLALTEEHAAFADRRRDLEALRDANEIERSLLAEERQAYESERQVTEELHRLLEAKRENLTEQSLKLTEQEWRIEDLQRAYAEEARALASQVALHEQHIRDLSAELAGIHRSRLWRLGNGYWSMLRAVGFLRRPAAASNRSGLGEEATASSEPPSASEGEQVVPEKVRKIEEARLALERQRQELEREQSALHEQQRTLAEQQRRLTAERREIEVRRRWEEERGHTLETRGREQATSADYQRARESDRISEEPRSRTFLSPDPVLWTTPSRYDVICFPIIDWDFRYQRPQQLMAQFALHGHRSFYLRTTFHRNGPSALVEPIQDNVFSLHMPGSPELSIIGRSMPEPQLEILMRAFEKLRQTHDLREAVCVVDLPFWTPLVFALRRRYGWKVVYDCLDDLSGFSNIEPELLEAEHVLISESDLVMVTSRLLHEKVSPQAARTLLNPNAADFDHFHCSPNGNALSHLPRPVIGYYGAISEWFDVELVRHAAAARPQWQFVLIGDTWGADVSSLEELPNVHLLGEMPYDKLPAYLHAFDVATIPFKINDLTRATNPVKFFEYLSAAKPIVAVELPELEPFPDYYYPARSRADFVAQLEAALAENPREKRRARLDFARRHTWKSRFDALAEEVRKLYGKVAIVIVSFHNLDYLRHCLESVGTNTEYPNFEVVVVDNGSGPDVESFLRDMEARVDWLKVIFNGENLGFPRANNIGIRAAGECDYVVLLNDDVFVTRGWLSKLIRYLDKPGIELVGPTTNWAGNEARIEVGYETLEDMETFAERYMREHEGEYFYIKVLAMYCVAMRRSLLDRIGFLDERFGIGMFEDDDFSRRVREAGGEVICAEDVFIHHWGRSSFGAMDQQVYDRLFEDNRRHFEEKWAEPWEPHRFRET